jgi:hypothetical protein
MKKSPFTHSVKVFGHRDYSKRDITFEFLIHYDYG